MVQRATMIPLKTIGFRETGHKNYAKAVVLLLIQYDFMASGRVAKQILTSHTKGRTACNQPCDLHLKHLNRRLKGILTRMESNVKPSAVTRAAKPIGIVNEICRSFGNDLGGAEDSYKQKKPSYVKECNLILDDLDTMEVYQNISNLKHKNISM